MAESWQTTNKFRLFVLVMMSLLTSIASIPAGGFTARGVVGLLVNGAIAGFAYLLCPSSGPRSMGPGGKSGTKVAESG